MAFCALAVAALAVGPFLYRSMLSTPAAAPVANCSFLLVTGGLFVLFAVATIWLLRRSQQRSRQPDLDRRLREAVMGGDQKPSAADGASRIDDDR